MAEATAGRLDTTNIAEIFHTALRKVVDGSASVASWNMLNFLSDGVRSSFYAHLSAALADVPFDAAALRSAALSWQDAYRGREGYGEVCALSAVLKLHPAEDWVSISQFFRTCGAAPETDWDTDARSLWARGRDFDVRLSVRDGDGLEFASAKRTSIRVGGEWIAAWRCSGMGLDAFDVKGRVESLPEVVAGIADRVDAVRLAERDRRSRPEAVAALEGIDLAPVLDPSVDEDRRFRAMVGGEAELLMRRPSRVDGDDSVQYAYRVADEDQPSGHFFGYARVWRSGPDKDRLGHDPMLRKWPAGPGSDFGYAVSLGTDDDMVKATVRFDMEPGGPLLVTCELAKLASGARVLAQRTTEVADVAFPSTPPAGTEPARP